MELTADIKSYVRPYDDADYTALEALYNAAKPYEFLGEYQPIRAPLLAQDTASLKLFFESTIFVFDDGTIKGFIGVKRDYISWLFVHPRFHGKGIGRRLLTNLIGQGSTRLELNVLASNRKAMGLYRSLGFKVVSRDTCTVYGRKVEFARMVRNKK